MAGSEQNANQHWFMSLDEARRKCEAWRRDDNEHRHADRSATKRRSISGHRLTLIAAPLGKFQKGDPRLSPGFFPSLDELRAGTKMCEGLLYVISSDEKSPGGGETRFRGGARAARRIAGGLPATGRRSCGSEKEVGLRQARKLHVLQQYARVPGHRRMDEDVISDLLHVAVAEREQIAEVSDRGGGEVDPVDAGLEVDDDVVLVLAVCAEMIEDESVGTAAASQGVVAVAILECVGAIVSLQEVRINGAHQILDVG